MEFNINENHSEYGAVFSIIHQNKLAVSELSFLDKESALSWLIDIKKVKNTNLIELINNSNVHYYNRLNVPLEIRNLGLGKILLNKTIDYCAENNILLINTVNNYGEMSNKSLIDFYKKSGMQLISKEGLMVYHKEFKNEKKSKSTI